MTSASDDARLPGPRSVPPVVEALSGSVGAAVANVLLYPLDLTTARLQTKTPQAKNTKTSREQHERKADSYSSLYNALQTIYASGGIAGFYQGLAADTLATALSNFLYFYAYSALHKLLLRRKLALDKDRDIKLAQPFTGTEELIIGCIAGIISRAVTTPLSAITVRKQTAAKSRSKDEEEDKNLATVEDEEHEDSEYSADSSTAIAKDIYQTYGISGFWRGYGSACALTVNPAITFFLIATLKNTLLPRRYRGKPTAYQTFFISASASAIASSICYPLILSKTRMQWKSPGGRQLYRNMLDVFTKTIARSGITGLYVGLQAQIIKGFLAHGVTMVIKQRVEGYLRRLYHLSASA